MEKIYEILANVLELEAGDIDPNRPLVEYETWDSVGALSLVVSVRAACGAVINSEEMQQAKTAADLEQLVASKTGLRGQNVNVSDAYPAAHI